MCLSSTILPKPSETSKSFKRYAYGLMTFARSSFDFFTNYGKGKMTVKKWLFRMIFLETVAGVPGMVAGMTLHLRSLRKCQPDRGYIHTLLQEAENERMHLMTFLHFR